MSTIHPITILNKPEQEGFLVESETQRRNQIKAIINKEILVTVYLLDGDGKNQLNFSTHLLAINQEHNFLILDTTPNEKLNRQIADGAKLHCATAINDVPIEFELITPRLAELAERPVFVTPLPEILVRMQRRAFFRIDIPASISAFCIFPTDTAPIKMELTDISIGGFSILVCGHFPRPFKVGETLKQCEIQLSLNDSFKIDLEVKNHLKKPVQNGKEATLIGFTFIEISAPLENQIQRFIFNIESKKVRTR